MGVGRVNGLGLSEKVDGDAKSGSVSVSVSVSNEIQTGETGCRNPIVVVLTKPGSEV
jgi:hypothetical protein